VNNFAIFVGAIFTGVGSSFVTSFFSGRTAKEDRIARVSLAEDDREFEVRKTACVALEMQRQRQLEYASSVQVHSIFPSEKASLSPVARDPELEALMAIALPESIRELVGKANEQLSEYLKHLSIYETAEAGLHRGELRKVATGEFDKLISISKEMGFAIRDEAGIAR
jgi:hypothetical protein